MTTLRKVALSALLTVSAFSAVTFTGCKKDDAGCAAGYEGTDCKTLMSAKFTGTYTGAETCTAGTDNYTVSITPVTSDLMKITYTNLYNAGYTATCTMTSSTEFTFSGTQSGATFTGSGSLSTSGTSLTVKYTIADASITNSCTFIGTKN